MTAPDRRQWSVRLAADGQQLSPLRLSDPRPPQQVTQALAAFGRPGRPTRPEAASDSLPQAPPSVTSGHAWPEGETSEVQISAPSVVGQTSTEVQISAPSVVGQTSTELQPTSDTPLDPPVRRRPVGQPIAAAGLRGLFATRAPVPVSTAVELADPSARLLPRLAATPDLPAVVQGLQSDLEDLRLQVAALTRQLAALQFAAPDEGDGDGEAIEPTPEGAPPWLVYGPDGAPVDPVCLPALPQVSTSATLPFTP